MHLLKEEEVFISNFDGFGQEGVTGLKSLGVRELTYKLIFMASFIQQVEEKTALSALHDMTEEEGQDYNE